MKTLDDNAFDELINQYAEAEGLKLTEENERLKSDPDFVYPEGLDEKCLAAIDVAFKEK